MKDKIIVITGATRGIGLALKEKLSGTNTVVTMSRSETPDGKTAFKADVGNRAEVKEVFDSIGSLYGRIDILINNAGYGLSGATELLPEAEVRRITDTNFLGALWCCQCALPYMEKGAKIANISSLSGLCPMPFRTMYNSTKAALSMLSYSLNVELRPIGIDCTVFLLGAVKTDFSKNRTLLSATDARYGEAVKNVDDFVYKKRNKGKLSLEYLTDFIVKKLKKKRIKPRYVVGLPYRLAYVICVFFPVLAMRLTSFIMKR